MRCFERMRSSDRDERDYQFEQIVGKSSALKSVLENVERVALTDCTVLIRGETGTGKELIARAIHDISPRYDRPYIKLNCAAIPFDLLESELFGHERGAFTGAIAQRTGRFELADKGTLFLDEVGDIPWGLQPKLLRVLQEQEIERLGSTHTYPVDVRLIAATNQDLSSMVEQAQFREDLYYRLNVFPIHVPPLRERTEDIPLLVRHFVEHFARRIDKTIEAIPEETMQAFTLYSWPGNIRELQNVIQRAVILSSGPVLKIAAGELPLAVIPTHNGWKQHTLEQAERMHILATLKETDWVLSGPKGAAVRLGINRSTLYFYMKKLGIVRPSPLDAGVDRRPQMSAG
jgi:formate hydrogenlyase transcriptional activator